jgi:phosphate transport system permease protein
VNAFALLFLVAGLGLIGWLTARARANRFDRGGAKRLHSLPVQHGMYVAMWTMLPALLFVAVWSAVSPGWSRSGARAARRGAASPVRVRAGRDARRGASAPPRTPRPSIRSPTACRPDRAAQIALWLDGQRGRDPARLCRRRLRFHPGPPGFRARSQVERGVMVLLLVASLIAILTTLGIFLSLLWESLRFFQQVPIGDFLFGTHWSPQVIDAADPGKSLGAVPLFWGTFFIGAVIAMIVAIPLG